VPADEDARAAAEEPAPPGAAEEPAPPGAAAGASPPLERGSGDGATDQYTPAAQPEGRSEGPPSGATLTIGVTADQPIAFTTSSLQARAGQEITIVLTNDSTVPHNIAVYEGPDATGRQLAKSETITGPGARTEITFVVPGAGEHLFRCELHPVQMAGTLTATP
jgi:plastocyanin